MCADDPSRSVSVYARSNGNAGDHERRADPTKRATPRAENGGEGVDGSTFTLRVTTVAKGDNVHDWHASDHHLLTLRVSGLQGFRNSSNRADEFSREPSRRN